ncbi:MAG: cbb3-type cytochrome c oxidase subunit I [Paenibacillaceae bacterium]
MGNSDTALHTSSRAAQRTIRIYMVISGIVLFSMMILGFLMLLSQGEIYIIDDLVLYEIMTIHGTGMIGIGALAAAAIMWHFLSQYVQLSTGILIANLVFFLIGVLLVLIGVLKYNFAGAWTFLYPLPAMSGGAWNVTASVLYLSGMLLIGIGFILFYLDVARALIVKYGSLGKTLGWPIIFGKSKEKYGPPPTVVASTMVTIVNLTAMVAGATVLVINLINVIAPEFTFDALIAKNLTYAFGHIFANSIIYMGVIAVYEILPRYTNRPWKSNKIFLIAWNMSTLFTIIIYPHHLFMDFAMPQWVLILAQILSYMNGIPALVVTAFGAIMIVYRSGIRWDMASGFIFFAMLGWITGVVPAIVDATITVNSVMHNTKWVPGHFHMYMGIGAVSMIFGFMYYLIRTEAAYKDQPVDRVSMWTYVLFFFGLCGSFLFSGVVGAPRRWAVHAPEWVPYDKLGALCALFVILATATFVIRFLSRVGSMGVRVEDVPLLEGDA